MSEEQEGPLSEGGVSVTSWEFIDKVPTRDDVVGLLSTLPDVHGVSPVDYVDFVQGLPSNKKQKVPDPDHPGAMRDLYIPVVTIYMSVAGRIQMLNEAANANDWRVDFEPEPLTPTEVPGFISLETRIVYREYCSVYSSESEVLVGRRPGTAWVPYLGGNQAAGSNPYEKVETAARGRALAAWGFGVFPGSGVASIEEMRSAVENRTGMAMESAALSEEGRGGGRKRPSKDEAVSEALTVAEQVRQARSISEDEMKDRVGKYLSDQLGIRSVYDESSREVDWAKVKDGQVLLLLNSLRDTLRQIRNEEEGL